MITREQIMNLSQDWEQSIPLLEPARIFDTAIIGWSRDPYENLHIIYDQDLILESLQKNDGMSEEDAVDYYEYTVRRKVQNMGENHPIISQSNVPECYDGVVDESDDGTLY